MLYVMDEPEIQLSQRLHSAPRRAGCRPACHIQIEARWHSACDLSRNRSPAAVPVFGHTV